MSEVRFERLESSAKDGGQRIEAEVTVSTSSVSATVAEFYDLMSRVHGAGGAVKASREELADRIGDSELADACRDYALNKFATAAVRELGVDTVLAPGVHAEDYLRSDRPFSFSLSLVPRPKLSLSSVEPVRIEASDVEVDERDIDEHVAFAAQQFAALVPVERSVLQEGDFAVMDVDMRKNGKACKDLSGTRRVIEVRRGLLPEAFVAGVLGMGSGEIRKLEFDLEPAATSDSASSDHYVADVRLWELREKEAPLVDDGWVADNLPQFESLACFRDYIRKDLEEQKQKVKRQHRVYRARKALEERLVGQIPDEMYQSAKDSLVSSTVSKLQSQGKTLEQYCDEHGVDKATFSMNAFMQASELLRQNLALDILAKDKGFEETDEEVEAAKAALPQAVAKLSPGEFEGRGFRRALGEQIRRNKAAEWLVDTAVVA